MNALKTVVLCWIFIISFSQAQLLPNNAALNVQSVQRWMQSNRDFTAVIEVVDSMFTLEEELNSFDRLPVVEQDQKINSYLQQQKMLEAANEIAYQHGWKSVGEYRRLSTKLGNAIAAHFLDIKMRHLTINEQQALRKKSDPAIVAIPPADIAFVKANEVLLKNYIQAYAARR